MSKSWTQETLDALDKYGADEEGISPEERLKRQMLAIFEVYQADEPLSE